ncbi:MAG: PLP-dependent aminotransferase family protein [Acidobacteriota bacterium]
MNMSDFYSDGARRLKPSAIRKMVHLIDKPGIISLAGGMPSTETFPMDIIRELFDQVYARRGPAAFQYGLTGGIRELAVWLAEFMATRGVTASSENIIMTSGSQQALRLVGEVFLDPGDVAVVELPSYIGGTTALRNAGADLVGVSQADDGIVTDELDATVARLKAQGRRVKLLYTIPNFQNPSGISISTSKRREILRLAARHDFLIIEDDPYYELFFGDSVEQPTMKSLDEDGRVIYLSSFSKILAPGFRAAWMCADPAIVRTIEIAKEAADICSSTMDQAIVLAYCKDGHLARHVPKIRRFYYERRNVMVDALRRHMPAGVTWTEPSGGFFCWARLPSGLDSEAMLPESVDRGVAYVVGAPFHVDGGGQNTLRLAYSKEAPNSLTRGVEILSKLISDHLRDPNGSRTGN